MVSTKVENARVEKTVRPHYDTAERNEDYQLRVYMPGVNRQGIEVSLDQDVLSISGSRTAVVPESWRPLHQETRGEKYELRLHLNVEVDADSISATTQDGILTLTLPKAQAAKPRQITVE
jgi:HSP20 family protein